MSPTMRPLWYALSMTLLLACSADETTDLTQQILSPPSAAPEAAPPEDARCRLATADSAALEDCPAAAADADHDTIDDSTDRCPDTTPGVAVDATGCARR